MSERNSASVFCQTSLPERPFAAAYPGVGRIEEHIAAADGQRPGVDLCCLFMRPANFLLFQVVRHQRFAKAPRHALFVVPFAEFAPAPMGIGAAYNSRFRGILLFPYQGVQGVSRYRDPLPFAWVLRDSDLA